MSDLEQTNKDQQNADEELNINALVENLLLSDNDKQNTLQKHNNEIINENLKQNDIKKNTKQIGGNDDVLELASIVSHAMQTIQHENSDTHDVDMNVDTHNENIESVSTSDRTDNNNHDESNPVQNENQEQEWAHILQQGLLQHQHENEETTQNTKNSSNEHTTRFDTINDFVDDEDVIFGNAILSSLRNMEQQERVNEPQNTKKNDLEHSNFNSIETGKNGKNKKKKSKKKSKNSETQKKAKSRKPKSKEDVATVQQQKSKTEKEVSNDVNDLTDTQDLVAATLKAFESQIMQTEDTNSNTTETAPVKKYSKTNKTSAGLTDENVSALPKKQKKKETASKASRKSKKKETPKKVNSEMVSTDDILGGDDLFSKQLQDIIHSVVNSTLQDMPTTKKKVSRKKSTIESSDSLKEKKKRKEPKNIGSKSKKTSNKRKGSVSTQETDFDIGQIMQDAMKLAFKDSSSSSATVATKIPTPVTKVSTLEKPTTKTKNKKTGKKKTKQIPNELGINISGILDSTMTNKEKEAAALKKKANAKLLKKIPLIPMTTSISLHSNYQKRKSILSGKKENDIKSTSTDTNVVNINKPALIPRQIPYHPVSSLSQYFRPHGDSFTIDKKKTSTKTTKEKKGKQLNDNSKNNKGLSGEWILSDIDTTKTKGTKEKDSGKKTDLQSKETVDMQVENRIIPYVPPATITSSMPNDMPTMDMYASVIDTDLQNILSEHGKTKSIENLGENATISVPSKTKKKKDYRTSRKKNKSTLLGTDFIRLQENVPKVVTAEEERKKLKKCYHKCAKEVAHISSKKLTKWRVEEREKRNLLRAKERETRRQRRELLKKEKTRIETNLEEIVAKGPPYPVYLKLKKNGEPKKPYRRYNDEEIAKREQMKKDGFLDELGRKIYKRKGDKKTKGLSHMTKKQMDSMLDPTKKTSIHKEKILLHPPWIIPEHPPYALPMVKRNVKLVVSRPKTAQESHVKSSKKTKRTSNDDTSKKLAKKYNIPKKMTYAAIQSISSLLPLLSMLPPEMTPVANALKTVIAARAAVAIAKTQKDKAIVNNQISNIIKQAKTTIVKVLAEQQLKKQKMKKSQQVGREENQDQNQQDDDAAELNNISNNAIVVSNFAPSSLTGLSSNVLLSTNSRLNLNGLKKLELKKKKKRKRLDISKSEDQQTALNAEPGKIVDDNLELKHGKVVLQVTAENSVTDSSVGVLQSNANQEDEFVTKSTINKDNDNDIDKFDKAFIEVPTDPLLIAESNKDIMEPTSDNDIAEVENNKDDNSSKDITENNYNAVIEDQNEAINGSYDNLKDTDDADKIEIFNTTVQGDFSGDTGHKQVVNKENEALIEKGKDKETTSVDNHTDTDLVNRTTNETKKLQLSLDETNGIDTLLLPSDETTNKNESTVKEDDNQGFIKEEKISHLVTAIFQRITEPLEKHLEKEKEEINTRKRKIPLRSQNKINMDDVVIPTRQHDFIPARKKRRLTSISMIEDDKESIGNFIEIQNDNTNMESKVSMTSNNYDHLSENHLIKMERDNIKGIEVLDGDRSNDGHVQKIIKTESRPKLSTTAIYRIKQEQRNMKFFNFKVVLPKKRIDGSPLKRIPIFNRLKGKLSDKEIAILKREVTTERKRRWRMDKAIKMQKGLSETHSSNKTGIVVENSRSANDIHTGTTPDSVGNNTADDAKGKYCEQKDISDDDKSKENNGEDASLKIVDPIILEDSKKNEGDTNCVSNTTRDNGLEGKEIRDTAPALNITKSKGTKNTSSKVTKQVYEGITAVSDEEVLSLVCFLYNREDVVKQVVKEVEEEAKIPSASGAKSKKRIKVEKEGEQVSKKIKISRRGRPRKIKIEDVNSTNDASSENKSTDLKQDFASITSDLSKEKEQSDENQDDNVNSSSNVTDKQQAIHPSDAQSASGASSTISSNISASPTPLRLNKRIFARPSYT
ncbi:Spp41p SCDLUD_004913 [Saccharomycodes ludwigii]|uniref:Spp41p n=1 Tax=Saccharomycodes ludwigii TaxID=36035 RepID=UPI001E899344|nr:hypothetical protein SCDLUD_004913 [Saccharomycodes ludwigii]KAH3899469.1 hypothetical protein SCDLUD_004913 [Saccharomycodes ludwigii]